MILTIVSYEVENINITYRNDTGIIIAITITKIIKNKDDNYDNVDCAESMR